MRFVSAFCMESCYYLVKFLKRKKEELLGKSQHGTDDFSGTVVEIVVTDGTPCAVVQNFKSPLILVCSIYKSGFHIEKRRAFCMFCSFRSMHYARRSSDSQ